MSRLKPIIITKPKYALLYGRLYKPAIMMISEKAEIVKQ